ncbi:MAG TPA: hypothetical protein VKE98_07220 [Gemmataceae bacterium]|nr:hypothetical protein [Gemmataceae bacterium]
MKTYSLARAYNSLTPEERFALILAADGRGDEAEAQRLARAAPRISLSMPDYALYMQTFAELAPLTFIELLADAATYLDLYTHMKAFARIYNEKEMGEETDGAEVGGEQLAKHRYIDRLRAAGYRLRAKANGWKRFCEQMNVPPFLFCNDYPGFERLKIALKVAEEEACSPGEYLRWLNCTRPEGAPELIEVPLSDVLVAAEFERGFRQRVRF